MRHEGSAPVRMFAAFPERSDPPWKYTCLTELAFRGDPPPPPPGFPASWYRYNPPAAMASRTTTTSAATVRPHLRGFAGAGAAGPCWRAEAGSCSARVGAGWAAVCGPGYSPVGTYCPVGGPGYWAVRGPGCSAVNGGTCRCAVPVGRLDGASPRRPATNSAHEA
ncbi:hypothetical protein MTP03_43720 [Tsukamurella sp. PLM1]|nr:hypothetical protein MTP03_43720 [Tsukamurella sp. PLM1]